jgi:acyl carrier protein
MQRYWCSDMTELESMRELVVRALAMELRTSERHVRSARSLRNELGLDSIAAANVTFVIEEELGVELDIREDDAFETLDDVLEVVARSIHRR